MTQRIDEYHDIAMALCAWFESQEIAPQRAVGVMAYLIGVMAAEGATTPERLAQRCKVAFDLSAVTAVGAFEANRRV